MSSTLINAMLEHKAYRVLFSTITATCSPLDKLHIPYHVIEVNSLQSDIVFCESGSCLNCYAAAMKVESVK